MAFLINEQPINKLSIIFEERPSMNDFVCPSYVCMYLCTYVCKVKFLDEEADFRVNREVTLKGTASK